MCTYGCLPHFASSHRSNLLAVVAVVSPLPRAANSSRTRALRSSAGAPLQFFRGDEVAAFHRPVVHPTTKQSAVSDHCYFARHFSILFICFSSLWLSTRPTKRAWLPNKNANQLHALNGRAHSQQGRRRRPIKATLVGRMQGEQVGLMEPTSRSKNEAPEVTVASTPFLRNRTRSRE